MWQINAFLLVFFVFFNTYADAREVVILSNNKTLTSQEPLRLDSVLTSFAPSSQTYWPATALYQLPATEAEILRSKVLQMITYLAASEASNKQRAMQQLAKQIANWQLAKPVLRNLDYDLARTVLSNNPLLSSGNYLLLLPERPSKVMIFGAIFEGVVDVSHQSAIAIDIYLDHVTPVAANYNHLFVLQTDGRLLPFKRTGVKTDYLEVQPGGIIFVPFARVLLEQQYTELNELLIQLVQFKVAV